MDLQWKSVSTNDSYGNPDGSTCGPPGALQETINAPLGVSLRAFRTVLLLFRQSDHGCHQRVASAFREGENTQISDPEKCDQMYESLARINSNVYKEKFPRAKDTSFTGVTVEECRMLLATGNMQQTDEDKKGLWKTLMERFSSKPEDASPEKPEKQ
ncbi:hypothetical protein AOLI_G00009300 [Acnodon oligacanthus]